MRARALVALLLAGIIGLFAYVLLRKGPDSGSADSREELTVTGHRGNFASEVTTGPLEIEVLPGSSEGLRSDIGSPEPHADNEVSIPRLPDESVAGMADSAVPAVDSQGQDQALATRLGQDYAHEVMFEIFNCFQNRAEGTSGQYAEFLTLNLRATPTDLGSFDVELISVESDQSTAEELRCFVENLDRLTVPSPESLPLESSEPFEFTQRVSIDLHSRN